MKILRARRPIVRERRLPPSNKHPQGLLGAEIDLRYLGYQRVFYSPLDYEDFRTAAIQYAEQCEKLLKQQGPEAFTLDVADRVDAQLSLKLLRDANLPPRLEPIIREHVARHGVNNSPTFSTVRAQFLKLAAEGGRMKPRARDDLTERTARFERDFGTRPIASIQSEEIDYWLRQLGLSLQSQKHYRGRVHQVFDYAVRRKHIAENPFTHIDTIRVPIRPPSIHTLDELRALLETSHQFDLLGFACLMMFGCLRRSEAQQLEVTHFQKFAGHIQIEPPLCKTNSARTIKISETLAAWMPRFMPRQGRIVDTLNFDGRKNKWYEAAHITRRVDNGLRHSSASYQRAYYQNETYVAEQHGHTVHTFRQKYKTPLPHEHGISYMALKPVETQRIVSLARHLSPSPLQTLYP